MKKVLFLANPQYADFEVAHALMGVLHEKERLDSMLKFCKGIPS